MTAWWISCFGEKLQKRRGLCNDENKLMQVKLAEEALTSDRILPAARGMENSPISGTVARSQSDEMSNYMSNYRWVMWLPKMKLYLAI